MPSNIPLHYNGKQPYGSNQCGAYALSACLLALGKAPQDDATDLEYQLPGLPWSRSARVPPSQVDPATSMDLCFYNGKFAACLCFDLAVCFFRFMYGAAGKSFLHRDIVFF